MKRHFINSKLFVFTILLSLILLSTNIIAFASEKDITKVSSKAASNNVIPETGSSPVPITIGSDPIISTIDIDSAHSFDSDAYLFSLPEDATYTIIANSTSPIGISLVELPSGAPAYTYGTGMCDKNVQLNLDLTANTTYMLIVSGNEVGSYEIKFDKGLNYTIYKLKAGSFIYTFNQKINNEGDIDLIQFTSNLWCEYKFTIKSDNGVYGTLYISPPGSAEMQTLSLEPSSIQHEFDIIVDPEAGYNLILQGDFPGNYSITVEAILE